jgi:hypothetical protein
VVPRVVELDHQIVYLMVELVDQLVVELVQFFNC